MAIRQIRTLGDPVLEKKSREVKELTPRLKQLIEDMLETMYENSGIGLAAPQVGVLRRIVVIDAGEEFTPQPLVLINPRILETEGEQKGAEGCLSVPGKAGEVTRPERVKVAAFNENMEPVEVEGEGLLSRAICHELDHLEGIMYVTKVEGGLFEVGDEPEGDGEAEETAETSEESTAGKTIEKAEAAGTSTAAETSEASKAAEEAETPEAGKTAETREGKAQ